MILPSPHHHAHLSARIASYRLPRITAPRITRRQRLDALPWAVWLGANTASRLAHEWDMSVSGAHYWLIQGTREGLLRERLGKPSRYRVTRLEPGMHAKKQKPRKP